MTDYDPRIAALYDGDNPPGPDHDLYRRLADEIDARAILDIGCGTGILTVTFAGPGREVVGIDPSATMLEHAVHRPSTDTVRWILGDSRAIPHSGFDYAVLSGNVAQHIPDPDWERTLADVRDALRTGGVLAFESRNPNARAWRRWADEPAATRRTIHGTLREWTDVRELGQGRVLLDFHTVFEDTGEHHTEQLCLAFRDRELIERHLRDAGFTVENVWSDWDRTPYSESAPVMIFRARRE